MTKQTQLTTDRFIELALQGWELIYDRKHGMNNEPYEYTTLTLRRLRDNSPPPVAK